MKDKIVDIITFLFGDLWDMLIKPFAELKTLKSWVFGKDAANGSELIFGTFTEDNINNVFSPGYITMMTVAGTLFVLAVVIQGMRIQSAALNPNSRSLLIEFIKDLMIVGVLLFQLPTLLGIIFEINQSLVNVFEVDFEMKKVQKSSELDSSSFIGDMVIGLVLLGLTIWANFYYAMRKFTLIILMIVSPLMVVFFLFPKFKGITQGWLKELIGTVFIQAIHAFVYWVLALMAAGEDSLILTVIYYMIFIPIGEALKYLFGLSNNMSSNLSKAGAMMGIGALAGMAGAVKGALGDQSVSGALKGMYKGAKGSKSGSAEGESPDGKPTLGGNTGPDTGTTSVAEKMLKAGDITSKFGKASLGIAGSLVGSPMGPVGAIAGASAGALAGEAAGSLAGRSGFAVLNGAGGAIAERFKKGKAGFKSQKDKNDKSAEDEVVSRIAEDETTQWASKNREAFMNDMKEKFPAAHKDELEKKWSNRVGQEKEANLNKARASFNELKPLISSDDAVKKASGNAVQAWADQNKEDFMKQYEKENPPSRPLDQMNEFEKKHYNKQKNAAWNDKVSDKKNEYQRMAQQVANNAAGVGVDSKAVKKEVDGMTSQWANDNEANFKKQYEKENPPSKDFTQMSAQEKEQYYNNRNNAWANKVDQKRADFTNQVQGNHVSADRKGNYGINGDSFAKNFASKIESMEKAEVRAKNPNASKDELELEFKKVDNKSKAIVESISKATNTADKFAINNGRVNTGGIAQFIAKQNTESDKRDFLNTASINNVPKQEALEQWKERAPQVSANNLERAQATMSKPLASQNNLVKGMKIVGATVGSATGLAAVVSSAKTIGTNVATGAATGWTEAVDLNSTTAIATVGAKSLSSIKGAGSGLASGIQQFKNETKAPPIEAQKAFTDKAGYASGVVFGKKGYTVGSQLAAKYNPHNEKVNNLISEPGEVMQMAHKVVDDNGTEQIAKGAVRMVTTADESFIQVRTRTGEVQQVSRTAKGDSGLKKGEVVYQDLNVQDGAFVPNVIKGTNTSAYKMDSTGSKMPFNRSINIAPSSLLSNHSPSGIHNNTVSQPFNQSVDNGQFNLGDLRNHQLTDQIELVTTREQSYLQASGADGQKYRVSKISTGDPRLNQQITQPITVKNHKLVKEDIILEDSQVFGMEEGKYTSSVDPNDLLPPIPNNRYANRLDGERGRYKGVSI